MIRDEPATRPNGRSRPLRELPGDASDRSDGGSAITPRPENTPDGFGWNILRDRCPRRHSPPARCAQTHLASTVEQREGGGGRPSVQQSYPAELMRFMPSGFSAVSTARPTRITALIRSPLSGRSRSQRSPTWVRGITSVCPGVAGLWGKNATQSVPSQTTFTEGSSPLAMSQNSQSTDSAPAGVVTSLRPSQPFRPSRPSCHSPYRRTNDRTGNPWGFLRSTSSSSSQSR